MIKEQTCVHQHTWWTIHVEAHAIAILLISPLVNEGSTSEQFGYPCFTTSWEAQELGSELHNLMIVMVKTCRNPVVDNYSMTTPNDRRCSENILISVSKPTGHRGEQIHLHWFVQSILSALTSWVETWTTWTTWMDLGDFFWPDLGGLTLW